MRPIRVCAHEVVGIHPRLWAKMTNPRMTMLARERSPMACCFPRRARNKLLARAASSLACASLVLLGAGRSGAAPTRTPPTPVAVAPGANLAPNTASGQTEAPAAASSVAPAAASTSSVSPSASPAATPANGGQPSPTGRRMIGLATDGVAKVAPSTPAEKRAAALAFEATNKDFLAMAYDSAEKKLRRAIQNCLQQSCSVRFQARLHRDIGVIYIVGLNRIEDGKDEFATALSADPTVAIDADMNTQEVETAFLEVRRAMEAENQPNAMSEVQHRPGSSRNGQSASGAEATAQARAAEAWRDKRNWVSLGIQQDFMLHSATSQVCDQPSYRCYDAQNQPQTFAASGRVVAKGNEISSGGFRPATLRLLVGYERLLSKNFSIGLKVGIVVYGKAPRVIAAAPAVSDPSFLAFHGEARLTLYPGRAPFARTKVARPYLFASAGVAEVDGKVSVEVFEQNQPYARVAAWKRSGQGFFGAGFGLAFAFGENHGPFLEARLMQMLGKSASVVATQGGYAVGF
jgi:hypothetical protein